MAILEFAITALIIAAGCAWAVSDWLETRRFRRGTMRVRRQIRQRRAFRIDALRGASLAFVGLAILAAPFLLR